jgi:hypothetical protein
MTLPLYTDGIFTWQKCCLHVSNSALQRKQMPSDEAEACPRVRVRAMCRAVGG